MSTGPEFSPPEVRLQIGYYLGSLGVTLSSQKNLVQQLHRLYQGR